MNTDQNIFLKLVVLFCLPVLLLACKREVALTPEKVYSGAVQLPQGLSEYDTTIQNFYNSTGTYIAYKFDNEGDLRFFMKGIPGTGITIPPGVYAIQIDSTKQGDIDTLNMAIDYVVNKLLRPTYPDKLMRQLLPYKILLYKYGRALTASKTAPTGYDTAAVMAGMMGGPVLATNLAEGFNCLGLGIVRKAASFSLPAGYSASNKKTFHQALWTGNTAQSGANGAIGKGRIPMPAGFKLTDYAALANLYLQYKDNRIILDSVCRANGTLAYMKDQMVDYMDYINKISANTRENFNLIYLDATDSKGLCARKRDVIVDFFKSEYNYDIENSWNR